MEKTNRKIKVTCGEYTIWYENGVYKVYDMAYPDYEELCIYEGSNVDDLLFTLDMRKVEYTKKHCPGANMAHNMIAIHYNYTKYDTVYGQDYMFDFDTKKRVLTPINNEYPILQDLFAKVLGDMAE